MAEAKGVDASIYNSLMPQPTQLQTPMEALATVMPVVQGINSNKLFQARQAVGSALQQATDPQTGQLDPLKFQKLTAQNPQAAAAMQEAASQGQALQGAQSDLATKQRISAARDTAGLLSLPDSQLEGGKPVFDYLNSMLQSGAINQPTYNTYVSNLPPQGAPAAAFRQSLTSHLVGTLGGQQAIDAVIGSRATMNNGQSEQPGVMGGVLNPQGAGFTPAGPATQVYPSRAQQATVVPTQNAQGQATATPAGNLVGAAGRGDLLGPAGQGGLTPSTMGNGRYPMPQQGAAAPAASAPGAPGAAITGPAPGVVERNTADSAAFTNDQNGIPAANQRVQTLQEAQSALQQARTGKGSAPLQSLLSIINTVNPDFAKSIANTSGTDVEKFDLARKYLTDYARSSGAATNSDAQLAAAQGSNASTDISNQAAQDVVSLQIGRERQRIAQVQQAPNQTGIGYGQHASEFASGTDARGFAWDTYSPEQRQAILKSVEGNTTAKEKLLRSIGKAASLGFVPKPAGQ